jgi:hypothetical protein
MTKHEVSRRSSRLRGFSAFVALTFVASTVLAVSGAPSVPSPGKYRGANNNNGNNKKNNNPNDQTPAQTSAAEPAKIDSTALDQAKKDAAAARVEQQKAQAAVSQARARLMKDLDAKPELQEAKKKVDAARAAYDTASEPALK